MYLLHEFILQKMYKCEQISLICIFLLCKLGSFENWDIHKEMVIFFALQIREF